MAIQYRPRPFMIVGAMRKAVVAPLMEIFGEVPDGSPFRLDHIFVSYPRVVVANAQTSPDLSFALYDSRGVSLTALPVPFVLVTTPVGAMRVRGNTRLGLVYPPKTWIRMEVSGMGPGPETISVTFAGKKANGAR